MLAVARNRARVTDPSWGIRIGRIRGWRVACYTREEVLAQRAELFRAGVEFLDSVSFLSDVMKDWFNHTYGRASLASASS